VAYSPPGSRGPVIDAELGACPVDGRNRFAPFDRPDARFLDDVRAWPSVEPAIDFTSTGMLAFALFSER
jgi:hypothetical protein